MDFVRLLRVTEICLPIFALIALGKAFLHYGFMTENARQFLNKFVYYYSLPPLIFLSVAKQDVRLFTDLAILTTCFVPTMLVIILFMGLVKILKLKAGLAASFIFCSFYSNSAYIGFPLAQETYGADGLGVASVYNAVMVPIFVFACLLLIDFYRGGKKLDAGILSKLKNTLTNPIILACLAGILFSVFRTYLLPETGLTWARNTASLGEKVLQMLAVTGLPLSLIAVGGALHLGDIHGKKLYLGISVVGKLLLIPLLTFLLARYFFPHAAHEIVGTVILLHATPNAVVSYIIACQAGADDKFVASQLAISTAIAALTIPVWVYVLL